MIKYYKLTGSHIRTNKILYAEMFQLFGDGPRKSLSIPRYILVNEKGEIVEKDALRPSDKEKLYTQIALHIK